MKLVHPCTVILPADIDEFIGWLVEILKMLKRKLVQLRFQVTPENPFDLAHGHCSSDECSKATFSEAQVRTHETFLPTSQLQRQHSSLKAVRASPRRLYWRMSKPERRQAVEPWLRRCLIRCTRVRVFPVPGPASTRRGPLSHVTAIF